MNRTEKKRERRALIKLQNGMAGRGQKIIKLSTLKAARDKALAEQTIA